MHQETEIPQWTKPLVAQSPDERLVHNFYIGLYQAFGTLHQKYGLEFRCHDVNPDQLLQKATLPEDITDALVIAHYQDTPVAVHAVACPDYIALRYTVRDRGERINGDHYLSRVLHVPVTRIHPEVQRARHKDYLCIEEVVRKHHFSSPDSTAQIVVTALSRIIDVFFPKRPE